MLIYQLQPHFLGVGLADGLIGCKNPGEVILPSQRNGPSSINKLIFDELSKEKFVQIESVKLSDEFFDKRKVSVVVHLLPANTVF